MEEIYKHLSSTEPDTKAIPCPIHGGHHPATLYCYPSKYAGIWECKLSGISDSHDCQEFETTNDDRPATVCVDCGKEQVED